MHWPRVRATGVNPSGSASQTRTGAAPYNSRVIINLEERAGTAAGMGQRGDSTGFKSAGFKSAATGAGAGRGHLRGVTVRTAVFSQQQHGGLLTHPEVFQYLKQWA